MQLPRLMIAGVHSGVGKTTITLGILAALRRMGLSVQPYKVGPDYIDPGWHFCASGQRSHNLDSWMGTEEVVHEVFSKHAALADISVIEGVMGLFDGVKCGGIEGSSAHVAMILKVPVVLVVNVGAMAQSCVALVKGFMEYEAGLQLAGVILNQSSDFHQKYLRKALEEELGIPVLGCVNRCIDIQMPERHLGLLPAAEHDDINDVITRLADLTEESVDLQSLLRLARSANELEDYTPVPKQAAKQVCIGVARDEAFSFYYQDSLDYLEELGAVLNYFSPMHDDRIPAVDGLYLGGGFPEIFLEQLANNQAMHLALRQAYKKGMPIYGECGALMYLSAGISDFEQKEWPGVGIVPAVTRMKRKLVAMGYVEAMACSDSILAKAGETLKGHEFHYSTISELTEQSAAYTLTGGIGAPGRFDGYISGNLLASYIHLHLRSNPKAAKRFIASCLDHQQRMTVDY
ncbi:MAG: cobyrinate a,c-diamide synthase [Firmicutes bacterium HGW-Firmicutes-15]|nr:MAG: cobyrinate a,c-diamide synthase [Firmicutes bacterium HGW-Firmicutes-15]